jgi:hypothetical protein
VGSSVAAPQFSTISRPKESLTSTSETRRDSSLSRRLGGELERLSQEGPGRDLLRRLYTSCVFESVGMKVAVAGPH